MQALPELKNFTFEIIMQARVTAGTSAGGSARACARGRGEQGGEEGLSPACMSTTAPGAARRVHRWTAAQIGQACDGHARRLP